MTSRLSPIHDCGLGVDTFINIVRSAETFRQEQADRDAQSGVRWAGLDAEPFRAMSEEAVVREAAKKAAHREAYRASPQFRFAQALRGLEQLSYGQEADTARRCMERGFSFGEPVNMREIGAALAVLNPIAGRDARDARAALAELLMATAPMARAA